MGSVKEGVPQDSILGLLVFSILMHDLFLFTERCDWYNYEDDNSLSSPSKKLVDVSYNLHDGRNVIEWITKNDMHAKPGKFNFILFSPTPTEKKTGLQLYDGTSLMSETEVTVLGVSIDDELT